MRILSVQNGLLYRHGLSGSAYKALQGQDENQTLQKRLLYDTPYTVYVMRYILNASTGNLPL